ncbi:MAG: bifunctional proline dehydrogenase/L-glutamate gamma-semialdehyde dehydrogenase PutA [Silicimonas sp.]|nr:bifunctional proline dehydrogenase/L-glutamate gamma-semialdehyde dehydrogenase PutA [Silicimonas sp.]
MPTLTSHRAAIRAQLLKDEATVLNDLIQSAGFTPAFRADAKARAVKLVNAIRHDSEPGLMEVFLAEYGLSTDEGIALMCLAEALLRVPDADTIDALIDDKIAPSQWGAHLGKSSSSLVNASTWALMLTGKVLNDDEGMATTLRGAIKRLGEPVIRAAVSRAMRELGTQFVLGETIEKAVKRGAKRQAEGYTYSYDMLGEAAMTAHDAQDFYDAYAQAIAHLAKSSNSADIRENPGISIKLSALHPRYEVGQRDRVMAELVPRALQLARQAKKANMSLNIDAEEADRLDLSLDVIEAVLSDPSLAGWDGFGIVVQAYGTRAAAVLDWIYALAEKLDRKVMVRLVKGAYWDSEIKRAQVEGLRDFPVFTRKAATDVSYLACAKKLLGYTDRIYPQFATHNAHSVAAILEMGADKAFYEFQRLHGMGAALHDTVLGKEGTRCRIYAPVGAHEDLLAYLVRRLLENGANSSFVNQIVDEDVPAEVVAADPFDQVKTSNAYVTDPADLFAPERVNSRGWDLHDVADLEAIEAARLDFADHVWSFAEDVDTVEVRNPADATELVGHVRYCSDKDAQDAIGSAEPWAVDATERARVLTKASDLYEEHFGELFALLTREAGKTQMDAIAELREAVDFLRYYAARGPELTTPPRGLFTCISPWNFPLAIFTGQIAAALAAGNGVLAKPAEATSLIATRAVALLHDAGVPPSVLQLVPGRGDVVGRALTSDARIDGVCFTGSTATAQHINRAMAEHMSPSAPLIAETGGLNAMIVDSTALPEQAVRDIVASSFQSAGQRCSALRVLYLQKDIEGPFLKMLFGVMDELVIGNPWSFATDLGPAIDATAQAKILEHIAKAKADGRLLKELETPKGGHFVPPAVIRLNSIADLEEEIFGPVLHVVTFEADEIDGVVDAVNATGYGLTFGLHTRIDDRVEQVTERLCVGNIYVNRNQIGAVVGSQPFGGEGMSGTGPKAGGASYVARFAQSDHQSHPAEDGASIALDALQSAIDKAPKSRDILARRTLPGPTGESNRISIYGRGVVLCLGPTAALARQQAETAKAAGCVPICVAPNNGSDGFDGVLAPDDLTKVRGIAAVIHAGDNAPAYRRALAARDGAIIPLLTETDLSDRLVIERHICVDTTAAGGNASLLAQG